MKKIYRNLIALLENNIVRIHILKTWIVEWVSIIRKSSQYKNITWSSEEQKRFDNFWVENYGKKISPRWHKLYQSANGTFDEKYFPEILYSTKLEPKVNNYKLGKTLEDKSLVEVLYSSVKDIKFPKTIILNCSDIYYNSDRSLIGESELNDLLLDAGKVVIKPIVGSSSGDGVEMLNIKNGINQYDNIRIEKIIKEYKTNFIIQERLKQDEIFNYIYPNSINTIRIMTYILNNEIYHMPISIRFGANGQKVDNIHSGGIGIGVSDEGELKEIGYDNCNTEYTKHPNTEVVFKDYKIPFIKNIINVAYKAHYKTPHIGIVSWDFMVNQNEEIVLIEANLIGQGIWFPQIVNESSAFGNNTKDILQLIK